VTGTPLRGGILAALLSFAAVASAALLVLVSGDSDEEPIVPEPSRQLPSEPGGLRKPGDVEADRPGEAAGASDLPGSPPRAGDGIPGPGSGGSPVAPYAEIVDKARGLIDRLALARTEPEKEALRGPAREALLEAKSLLAAACEGSVKAPGAPAQPMAPSGTREVREWFDYADVHLLLGLACGDSDEKTRWLRISDALFQDVTWEFEDTGLGYLAYLRRGLIQAELGEYARALSLYDGILRLPDPGEDSPGFQRIRDHLRAMAYQHWIETAMRAPWKNAYRNCEETLVKARQMENEWPQCFRQDFAFRRPIRAILMEKAKALALMGRLAEADAHAGKALEGGGPQGEFLALSWAEWNDLRVRLKQRPPARTPCPEESRDLDGEFLPRARGSVGEGFFPGDRGPMPSAVEAGLQWLARHQNPDGAWSCRWFVGRCAKDRCQGPGSGDHLNAGVSGLALLAFLGAGQTHKSGPFREPVKRGLRSLLAVQTPDGCLGPRDAAGPWIYCHAAGTHALAEAFGRGDGSLLLQDSAQKAVDFLVECQNPYLGWRYGRQPGDNDSSVTAWAVMALAVARKSGLQAPKEAFDGALKWFEKATEGFETGYTAPEETRTRIWGEGEDFTLYPGLTAASLACRVLILGRSAPGRPEIEGAAGLLRMKPPKWDRAWPGGVDLCYAHWGSLATHQLGGAAWEEWRTTVRDMLLPNQVRTGCAAGSWDPVCAWGGAGGRVYSTAMAVLALEAEERYSRQSR
jgi:tetratricopeptide (TPR) repeat protein